MKKLLTSLATIFLSGTSALNSTIGTNQLLGNYHLQDFDAVNSVKANQYGSARTSTLKNFYIRFYITPSIYNMLSLAATAANARPDSAFNFYKSFLGETGKSPVYGTWSQAIAQFYNLINYYNDLYKSYQVDFGAIFKQWLINNWKTFYNVFIGKDFSTNDYHYYPFPDNMPAEKHQQLLEAYWRQHGIVMNIPFSYFALKLGVNPKWTIDGINLRIYPQLSGNKGLYYYYTDRYIQGKTTPPQVNVRAPEKGLKKAYAKDIGTTALLKAFMENFQVPTTLRNKSWYDIDESVLGNKYIYKFGEGPATEIDVKAYVYNESGSGIKRDVETYKILFYLDQWW